MAVKRFPSPHLLEVVHTTFVVPGWVWGFLKLNNNYNYYVGDNFQEGYSVERRESELESEQILGPGFHSRIKFVRFTPKNLRLALLGVGFHDFRLR